MPNQALQQWTRIPNVYKGPLLAAHMGLSATL